jgi:GNAT superfamily N-acetyltransferase
MLTLTPTAFDPKTETPERRLAVAEMMCAAFGAAYPADPPLIAGREAHSLTQETPGERSEHVVVWDGSRALAWGMLHYSLNENLHLVHARLIVHPDARRRGLGREVARTLQARTRALGRDLVTFMTAERAPAGEPFALTLGAQATLPMRRSQLVLEDVSPELLRAWTTRPGQEPYALHLWEELPEEYLERLADMVMVMNTAPRGDIEMDDWTVTPEMLRSWEQQIVEAGEKRLTAVIEDTRSGELVGFSDVFWSPERAPLVFQGGTAVRPPARGHGLGKWLKAAVLLCLPEFAPGAQFVRTSNAEENAAMLGINVALGFAPWDSQTEWKLHLT